MRIILGVACVLGSVAVSAQTCGPLQEYDKIVSTVTEEFYDKTFNGLDWGDRVSSHRAEIGCSDDAEDVATVVNSLLSELNASHTALYTGADLDYWGLNSLFHFEDLDAYQIYFTGIWPERRDGKWYAQFVLEASPAERAGIVAGDELIALDGAEFQPLGFGRGPSTLRVSSDGRTQRDVRVQPVQESIMRGFVDASRASAKVLSVGSKSVGYFHLWSARDLILQSLNEALTRFETMRVDALLLDYRGGYGGTSEEYLATLRQSAYLSRIPKYFLIDDSVRSGKELLAGIVKRDGLGTLVGSKTAGYYLGGRMNRLFDDKYFLYVAIGGGSVPGIGRIEGVGIQPDVYIAPCRAFCGGHDPQLRRALALIAG